MCNKEFNKILFSIIKFIEKKEQIILNGEEINQYRIKKSLENCCYKLDMNFDIKGNKINIFDYRLIPTITEYNSYYSNSLGPELIDIKVFENLINLLKRRYNDDLENYGYKKNLFDKMFQSVYINNKFNISIMWCFIKSNNRCSELANDLIFSIKDNIERIFNPQSQLEKDYYISKIKLVCDNKLFSTDWLLITNDDPNIVYTYNEMIHLINELIIFKDEHFYLKYQNYNDISIKFNEKKKKQDGDDNNEHDIINSLDELEIKFSYNGIVYKTKLNELYKRNYITLNSLFSLQKTINKKMYFDNDEYINYVYYLNGVLQNRYQNKNTLLYTVSTILNSYNNDMRSLYIIGESQSGKSLFKNIILNYINEFYEKTSTKQMDFNYDDSSILKIYDDVDILEKTLKRKTYLILNRDNYTVSINEKNKQPVKVYKNITNIVLNNDWPLINTWYHQRRIKTCLFIPNSKKSLEYIIQRIFKSDTRGIGSFNDVFINNFFNYLFTYRDELYYDDVYYTDCIHLLDKELPIDIIEENIKNILNLDSVIQARNMIKINGEERLIELKQQYNPIHLDYSAKNRFEIFI